MATDGDDPVQRVLGALRAHGFAPKRSATGHTCRCPAHEDRVDSLKIDEGSSGAIVYCYAGCRTEDVVVELKLDMKDLFYADSNTREPVATYDYLDATGKLVYQVCRWDGKRFTQRRPSRMDGEWINSLGDTNRLPYNLPELVAAPKTEIIYITEGEKDADAITGAGGIATTASGGAGRRSPWGTDWAPYFDGRPVVIVADADVPGREHAARILQSLRPVCSSVRIVEARAGKDAADHLAAGHALAAFVHDGQDGVLSDDEVVIQVQTWSQFRETSHTDPPMLFEGLWSAGAFGFIAGAPKARKTWLGLGMALSLAAGKPFLGQHATNAADVLYLALEGARGAIKQRVGCISRGLDLDPDLELDRFHICYRPPHMDLMQKRYAEKLRGVAVGLGVEMIFVDVLRAATVFDENSAKDFSLLMSNLRPILNEGISVGILHHFSKWGDTNAGRDPGDRMVGSGAMRGALDVGLYLTQQAGVTRVDSEARDLTMPLPFKFSLSGTGSGPNGGFTYRDACVLHLHDGEDTYVKPAITPAEIALWIKNNGGSSTPRLVCAIFQISDQTLRAMSDDLSSHGILPVGKGINQRLEAVQQLGIAS